MECTSGIVKLSTKEKKKSECQRLVNKRKKFAHFVRTPATKKQKKEEKKRKRKKVR